MPKNSVRGYFNGEHFGKDLMNPFDITYLSDEMEHCNIMRKIDKRSIGKCVLLGRAAYTNTNII